jgi:hypothetical protein
VTLPSTTSAARRSPLLVSFHTNGLISYHFFGAPL